MGANPLTHFHEAAKVDTPQHRSRIPFEVSSGSYRALTWRSAEDITKNPRTVTKPLCIADIAVRVYIHCLKSQGGELMYGQSCTCCRKNG